MSRRDDFIRSLGVEAYRVGGSVRDEILGKQPKDDDYLVRGIGLLELGHRLVSALQNGGWKGADVKPLKPRQGAQFGWRASAKGLGLMEIALPRAERSIGAGRAMEVTADPNMSLAEDAQRRDFTYNALYKIVSHPEGMHCATTLEGGDAIEDVLDPTGLGLHDLQHRIVRITHADSFQDDPVRMLRALRFVSTMGADLSSDTRGQMLLDHAALTGLTAKGYTSGTVYDEFSKLLMGQEPAKALRLARDTGVLAQALPELAAMLGFEQGSRYHDLTTDEHTFVALQTAAVCEVSLRVRWALLFHDAGKPATAWKGEDGRMHYYQHPDDDPESNGYLDPWDGHVTMDHEEYGEILWREAAARMNVPVAMREDVATLIREHMVPASKNPGSKVRRMRVRLGDSLLRDLLMHRMCDLSGKGGGKINKNHMEHIAKLEKLRNEALVACVPTHRKHLAVSGNDVKALGHAGRDIGRVLDAVLDEVVVDPSEQKLSREWQLRRAEAL